MRLTNSILLLLLVCGGVFAGFDKGAPGALINDGTGLITADGEISYDPKAELIRAAADFARLIANAKEAAEAPLPGGGQTVMSDVADEFDRLIDENRFCKDSGFGRGAYWAATETRSKPSSWTGTWEFSGSGGTPPGVNLNYDKLPCPTTKKPATTADLVVTASTLMHEAWHSLNDPPAGQGDPDETAANQFENEFLCCAKDILSGQLPTGSSELDAAINDAINAICKHVGVVADRLCKLGGPAPDFCGCDPLPELEWPPTPEDPPKESTLPRQDLDASEIRGHEIGKRNSSGSYTFTLSPVDGKMSITRYQANAYKRWVLDVGTLVGNGFAPSILANGDGNSLLIAGRNSTTSNAVVVRAVASLAGGTPVLTFTTLLDSASIGDITGMADLTPFNNVVGAFDYTNARLVYFDQTTGIVTEVLNSTQQPELLNMTGLMPSLMFDANTNAFLGASFYLQEQMDGIGLNRDTMVFVKDLELDGIPDEVLILTDQ